MFVRRESYIKIYYTPCNNNNNNNKYTISGKPRLHASLLLHFLILLFFRYLCILINLSLLSLSFFLSVLPPPIRLVKIIIISIALICVRSKFVRECEVVSRDTILRDIAFVLAYALRCVFVILCMRVTQPWWSTDTGLTRISYFYFETYDFEHRTSKD